MRDFPVAQLCGNRADVRGDGVALRRVDGDVGGEGGQGHEAVAFAAGVDLVVGAGVDFGGYGLGSLAS